jgi:hypothetical protein
MPADNGFSTGASALGLQHWGSVYPRNVSFKHLESPGRPRPSEQRVSALPSRFCDTFLGDLHIVCVKIGGGELWM